MTKEEFYAKYDKEVELSQSACNSLALLNRTTEMLRDWRSAGGEMEWRRLLSLPILHLPDSLAGLRPRDGLAGAV